MLRSIFVLFGANAFVFSSSGWLESFSGLQSPRSRNNSIISCCCYYCYSHLKTFANSSFCQHKVVSVDTVIELCEMGVIKLLSSQLDKFVFKVHLHNIHFGHSTPKFWHAGQKYGAQPAWFLPSKSKCFDPRAEKFRGSETTSGGSLGQPEKRSLCWNWRNLSFPESFPSWLTSPVILTFQVLVK